MDINKISINGGTPHNIAPATMTLQEVLALFSGQSADPTSLPTIITTSNIASNFATVATTGSYDDLLDKPTIPTIPAWVGSSKPSYTYSEVGYTATAVSASSSTLTLAGTDPIYIVTVGANISSVTLTANPSDGHSCHVLFVNSDASNDYTVTIGHDATNRVCPAAADLTFTVPKNSSGYVEVDFLAANNKVYVRGV